MHSQYSSRPLRWFLEPSRVGGIARYRGRESRDNDSMVFVPEHQRDFVWPVVKQAKLITSVFKGYPIPSIMVTEDDRNRYSLNDGQQRMETFWRYYTNQLAVDGKLYDNLTDDDKKKFLDYHVPIVDTTGATLDQETEIYDLLNQGVALSHGEKFWNRRSKPLVRIAEQLLLVEGSGLHAQASEVFGNYLGGEDKRHRRVENAIAYVAGAAYGSAYITTSYQKLCDVLTSLNGIAPDEELIRRRLMKVFEVYRLANANVMPTVKKARSQWKVGLYSAYILHSILVTEDDEEEWNDTRDAWVRFIVAARQSPAVEYRLYRGTVKSANITLDKCEIVHNNIIEMMNNGFGGAMEEVYEDDDTDDE